MLTLLFNAHTQCFVGGGGRSAVQLAKGTDVITAAGGGGAADCFNTTDCGGGGTVRRMHYVQHSLSCCAKMKQTLY